MLLTTTPGEIAAPIDSPVEDSCDGKKLSGSSVNYTNSKRCKGHPSFKRQMTLFNDPPYLYRMHFSNIINAALSNEADRPMMQKEVYVVNTALQQYLQQYNRDIPLPIVYTELLHYDYTNAIKDENGKHTHWERVIYAKELLAQLEKKLVLLYQLLKSNEDEIQILSVDYCEFANSMPFRINILHKNNHTTDRFYVKSADASRIFGLELEQLLTPHPINFLYHQHTLVEEHIEGMPGDVFLETANGLNAEEQKLLSAEFIRFNERCFARLLGDMRSYNFVVLTPSAAQKPFTIRAIDFDQQCYEGKLNLYLPQFYKENLQYVQWATETLGSKVIEEIRLNERKALTAQAAANKGRLSDLLHTMQQEELSENYKVLSLKKELNRYHHTHAFTGCKTMGEIVSQQLSCLTLF